MNFQRSRAALVVVTLSAIICIGSAIALQVQYIIHSSGSIGPAGPTEGGNVPKSEIRAMFMHSFSMINPNMDLIAQTCKEAGFNTLVIECLGNNWAHYPSAIIPSGEYVLQDAIDACHARGIQLQISMNVMLSSLGPEYRMETHTGTQIDWTCATKGVTRTLMQNLVQEFLQYDIDGFMFDYVRYETLETCYCPECRTAFQQYLGETISDWTPFYPGGARHKEFLEWRCHPINDLVGDMRSWMLAIKPDLEISAAVWGWEPTAPTYNKWWIGQDSAYWVKEGWLDWVAPMVYGMTGSTLQSFIQGYLNDMVAGPEGKIPLVPFLSQCYPSVITPATLKGIVDLIRQLGVDGFALWRYGGPGDGEGSAAPDIRNYFSTTQEPSKVYMYPDFSIENIVASPMTDGCVVTWTTDSPTTSKVEYSISPLFTAPLKPDPGGMDMEYYDMTYVPGTIEEDLAAITLHSITLLDLLPNTLYYYRVQSQDANGIATTKVYNFMTSGS